MKLIAIIPARSNSRRLPNKNFKNFFGKPIISWALEEAQKSELFNKIIISTDKRIEWLNPDHKIVKQFIRSSNNQKYDKTVDDVCLEVLEKYKDYDYMCCIYPTNYAVTWKHLCESFNSAYKLSSCMSTHMINFEKSPLIEEAHITKELIDNGGFYWQLIKEFKKQKSLLCNHPTHYKLPMVDINTIQDWCEAKLHAITLEGDRYK